MRLINRSRLRVAVYSLIIAIAIATGACMHSPSQRERSLEPAGDKFVFATEVNTHSGSGPVEKEFNYRLLAKDFSAIEAAADRARNDRERLPGGTWKLDAIYNGVGTLYAEHKGHLVTDDMWARRIELLKQWKLAMPNSITARVALAKAYADHGWYARGRGYINSVSRSDYETFQQRLAAAENELKEASHLETSCPRWYREAMMIGLGQGWPNDQFERVYENAIAAEPNYLQYHLIWSEKLTPKWSGQDGEWQRFVDSIPDKLATIEGAEADIIYFIIVANKVRDPSLNTNWGKISRDRIRRGFTQIEEKYGTDNYRLNQYAFLSALTQDLENSTQAFDRIGTDRNSEVWDEQTFNMMKALAKKGIPKSKV